MAATISCPQTTHVDSDVMPESYAQDFISVLRIIRPTWDVQNVVFKELPKSSATGLLNTMVRCHQEGTLDDSIMIRIHNRNLNHVIDRANEIRSIQHLNVKDCAPEILATFRTGFCYEYIEGTVLTKTDLSREPIWRSIAQEMAKINSCEIEPGDLKTKKSYREGMIANISKEYPTKLKDPIQNKRFKRFIPEWSVLQKEVTATLEHALSFKPDVVLCHNDTRAENIIWNEATGVAKFVDFEDVNYDYRPAELARHFVRFAGMNPPDYSLCPDEAFQLKWLRVYLEKCYELTGRMPCDVTDRDVRMLSFQTNKFKLLHLIFAAVFAPVVMNANMAPGHDVDILGHAIEAVKEYYRRKPEIVALTFPE